MKRLYEVRITTHTGESSIVSNVVEYVGGWHFFFCAVQGSRDALSFERKEIALVERRLPGQPWLRVALKRPPEDARA